MRSTRIWTAVFVEETARGEGQGRTLVTAAIERTRARGCRRIQLDANRDNEAVVSLYGSLGFAPVHNQAKWGDAPDFMFTLNLA